MDRLDHDLLVEIHTIVTGLHCGDHETRIRELEAWKNRIIGVSIGAGAVAGAVATVTLWFLGKIMGR